MNYFISDIHLKNDFEERAKTLILFCQKFSGQRLFLLGDIFDLWVADGKVFERKYQNVIQALMALKDKGVELHYFEGNHDVYLKNFWQKKMGFNVYDKPVFFNIDGLEIRMEHGDDANPEDKKYIKYKRFIRSPVMSLVAHILPGKVFDHFGNKASKASRNNEHRYPWDVASVLRSHIERIYSQKPFDVLITGHMHKRIDEQISVNNKTIRNINLGWWGEKPIALKLENAEFSWLQL